MADIRDYDVKVVKQLVSEKNYPELAKYMKEHGLVIKDGKVKSKNTEWLENNQKLYDLSQYVKKICCNSAYGGLLQSSCIAYDFRLGSSTTLTGRLVTKHMAERINDYTIKKCIYTGGTLIGGDTDSEKFDTKHTICDANGVIKQIEVEDLYKSCNGFWIDERTGKEYGFTTSKVLGYDDTKGCERFFGIRYVYRHKTRKKKWEIEDAEGNVVTVTEDHSCMVERDGKLISVKPRDITTDDILISL